MTDPRLSIPHISQEAPASLSPPVPSAFDLGQKMVQNPSALVVDLEGQVFPSHAREQARALVSTCACWTLCGLCLGASPNVSSISLS